MKSKRQAKVEKEIQDVKDDDLLEVQTTTFRRVRVRNVEERIIARERVE